MVENPFDGVIFIWNNRPFHPLRAYLPNYRSKAPLMLDRQTSFAQKTPLLWNMLWIEVRILWGMVCLPTYSPSRLWVPEHPSVKPAGNRKRDVRVDLRRGFMTWWILWVHSTLWSASSTKRQRRPERLCAESAGLWQVPLGLNPALPSRLLSHTHTLRTSAHFNKTYATALP